MRAMRIAHIAPEAAPFVKVGGLGDVASALPRAQAREGLLLFSDREWIRHGFGKRINPPLSA